MSHVAGLVLDARGGILGHFEYNGTVDVARAQIFASLAELEKAWRQEQPAACACHGVDVTLSSGQLVWDARACFEHGFIVHGRSPLYSDEEDA